jgi:TRAP-type C4-dicarboxylate transport system permease small subunit
MTIMFFSVLIQIVGRYFFRVTPIWTEELSRQLMVVFCFIGMAIGVRDKIHIALTFIVNSLNRKAILAIEILGKMLLIMMGIMMSVFMGPFFIILRYNRLPATGIPAGWRFAFPTAVGVLIALIALYQIYDHIKYGTDEDQKQRQLAEAEKAAKESAS